MVGRLYLKDPVPVRVEFAVEAGVMQTIEGRVAYARGDALVTGAAGERWPIPRHRFERTYRPATDGDAIGRNGNFIKQPIAVRAVRTRTAGRVPLSDGRGVLVAKPGDWILTDPDGETWIVEDTIFRETYRPFAPEPS